MNSWVIVKLSRTEGRIAFGKITVWFQLDQNLIIPYPCIAIPNLEMLKNIYNISDTDEELYLLTSGKLEHLQHGMEPSMLSIYDFSLIIILSLLVLAALVFVVCGLVLKAQAHIDAGPEGHHETTVVFGNLNLLWCGKVTMH